MHFKIKKKIRQSGRLAYDATSQPGIPTPLGDNVFFTWGMGWGLVGWAREHHTTILGKYL